MENSLQWNLARDLTEQTLTDLRYPQTGIAVKRLPKFSNYLNGLRPHELTLLCAGTGTGKTALMATLAADIVLQGFPVFAAPVETGDRDFLARVFSAASDVELNAAESVSEATINRVFETGIRPIYESPLLISNYDNRVDIDELLAVLTVMVQKSVKVALLDNLNFFLEITSSDMERAVMDMAIHKLVLFAKKNPIHILLICHPRKTDKGRVESEFDIKGSSTSVQECSNVILFNRPTEQQVNDGERSWTERELVFKKIRKRGLYVNKPIWMEYRCGGYYECS